MACPEQPFERLFGVAPLPPTGAAALFLEVRGPAGTLVADALEKTFCLCPALAREQPKALPASLPPICTGHPPAQQRMQRQRQEGRLVGPIFEQPPLLPHSPRGHVDQRAVIGPKPGEGWQVMSADQDIDAVDLMKAEAIEGPLPSRGRNLFRTRPSKTLRCESDPPSLGKGKLFDLRHVAPLTAFRPSSGPISTASAPPRISTQPRAPTAVRRSLSKRAPASAANTPSRARMSAASAGGVCAWAKI